MKKKPKKTRNPVAKELRAGNYRHRVQEERKRDYSVSKKQIEEILDDMEKENVEEQHIQNTTSRDNIRQ